MKRLRAETVIEQALIVEVDADSPEAAIEAIMANHCTVIGEPYFRAPKIIGLQPIPAFVANEDDKFA